MVDTSSVNTINEILEQPENKRIRQDYLPLFKLLNIVEEAGNGFFCLPLSRENIIENLNRITHRHPSEIKEELIKFESNFHQFIEIKEGNYEYDTGASRRYHPPLSRPDDSSTYYILNPELVHASETAFKNIDFNREDVFKGIISQIKTTEDLVYLAHIRRICEICKNGDCYPYEDNVKKDMREILEMAHIDNEIIDAMIPLPVDYSSKYIGFNEIIPYLPRDQRSYVIFYAHNFNTSSCLRKPNIFIEKSIAQFLFEKISEYPILQQISKSYNLIKSQLKSQLMKKNEERLPLLGYKDYKFSFMHKFQSRLEYSGISTFEFNNKEDIDAIKSLKDMKIIEIKDDKIYILSRNRFNALLSVLKQKEDKRISRNKKELLLKWLRNGIDITYY